MVNFKIKMPTAIYLYLLLFTSSLAWAHRPYVENNYGTEMAPILILDPEISQAYYRDLNGSPEHFLIKSNIPFLLHLNILEAYQPQARKDFIFEVFQGGQLMAKLEDSNWVYFNEPWGGDEYWMGPKLEQKVEAGDYRVRVSNPDNSGKYVLAVGTIDTFPVSEMVRTFFILPKIKSQFFERSAWSAYFNYSGLFILVLLSFLALFVAVVLKIFFRFRK